MRHLTIQNIINILNSKRLPINVEKELQVEIEKLFIEKGLSYQREYHLDDNNIPDFFIDGVAIEIKIKGSKKAIYKQCERYCKFQQTEALLLITSKSMGFPQQINNKDCYYYSLSKNWL
jgi:hypothetical protein